MASRWDRFSVAPEVWEMIQRCTEAKHRHLNFTASCLVKPLTGLQKEARKMTNAVNFNLWSMFQFDVVCRNSTLLYFYQTLPWTNRNMWSHLGWISSLNTDRAGVCIVMFILRCILSISTHGFFFSKEVGVLESSRWHTRCLLKYNVKVVKLI